MKNLTIFTTYNPKSDLEQTLAVRLHTIGAVNGFKMFLPDRFNSNSVLDLETKRRIDEADYFIMFSSNKLSTIVKNEIEHAFKTWNDKSKIIVIYESGTNLGIPKKMKAQLTALEYDAEKDQQDKFLQKIMSIIQTKELRNQRKGNEKLNSAFQALIAFFAIGLGLFILSTLNEDD